MAFEFDVGDGPRVLMGQYGVFSLTPPENLLALVDVLCSSALFAPDSWQTSSASAPFDRETLESSLADLDPNATLHLHRERSLRGTTWLDRFVAPAVSTEICADTADEAGECFALGDRLAAVFQPDFGATAWHPDLTTRRALPRDESTEGWSGGPYFSRRRRYVRLGFRTYFGQHFIDLIGRELLDATPGVVLTDLDWGGLRVDIGSVEPWTVPLQEVMQLRLAAAAHLAEAQVLATWEPVRRKGMHWFPGERCVVRRRDEDGAIQLTGP